MESGDSLSRLRGKLEQLKQERDHLNGDVLRDRQLAAQKESELLRLQADFSNMRARVQEKEHILNSYNITI
jgi:chromosome segregation ATPase